MYQDVDVIGVEQIVKLIQQSKLEKFMIFRKGSGKGSIPVFEGIQSKSNAACCQAFRDWAHSALNMNPNNISPYEILLYNKNVSDADLDNDVRYEVNAPKDELNASRRKENKIRFSFALNGVHSPQGMNYGAGSGLNVQEEVKRALDDFKKELEIKELKDRVKELEEGSDDDDGEGGLARVSNLLKEIRLAGGKKKGAAIAGDDDEFDESDLDEEEEEEEESEEEEEEEEEEPVRKKSTTKTKAARIEQQRKRLKVSLKILMNKDKQFITHLEKLARLAQKNPAMFKTVLTNLDALSI